MASIAFEEYKNKLNNLRPALDDLGGALHLDEARNEVEKLEEESAQDGFWNDTENSQRVQKRIKTLKHKLERYKKLSGAWEDMLTMCEMAIEEDDDSMLPDLESEFHTFEETLESMRLETLLTGEYDCAATRRTTRQGEPPIRSFFARLFYRIINKMSDTEIVDGARDYRLMCRSMVDAVLSMGEYNRFSKGIFSWVGFRTKWFEYVNVERVAGETKWNFWKLFLYSIEGIVGFTTAPLALAALVGLAFCMLAFVMILVVVVRAVLFGDPTSGWPSLVCIILLCSGVQLFCTGIVGEYLAKTYLEVKHRPIYIARVTEQNDPAANR